MGDMRGEPAPVGGASTPFAGYRGSLPWWWWLIMLGLLAVASALWRGTPAFPTWITRSSELIPPDRWHLLAAIYISGLVISHVAIYWVLVGLARLFRQEPAKGETTPYPPVIVGFVELILYPTALLAGSPEFIGFWLALKVAGQWKEWEAGYQGRALFNAFLVGSALSVMGGGLMYALIRSFVIDI